MRRIVAGASFTFTYRAPIPITLGMGKACICIGIVTVGLLSPLPARAESDSERLLKLEKAVEQLQKRNSELQNEVDSLKSHGPFPQVLTKEKTKAVAGNDNKAVFVAPSPPPVDVHPAGPEFKLTLGGYIQANFEDGDVAAFEGRFGSQALKDRFRLRRARITLTGEFTEQFDFKVEGDFGQGDGLATNRIGFSATDVFINWHGIPEMQLRVGQWKAPFGLENLTPDTLIYTIERSLPTGAIVPERQIGAMLWGKPFTNVLPDQKDLLTYYAGVFNGNGRNFSNNDNNEFMYVTRLELQPWKGKLAGQDSWVKLGGDYYYSRDDTGTNISPSLTLRVNNDGSLSPFVLTGPDERNAFSFDGWFRLGPFDLIAEYLEERVDGRSVNGSVPIPDFTANGYYIQGSYFIIPKKLQAVVKWEDFNPGQRANDGIRSITGGLNYYLHSDNIKLMADYIHTWSDFREANSTLGDDQFNEVILRLQVLF